MDIFDSGELPMVSGQGEAIKNEYDVYRGKDGKLWLVPFNVKNQGDYIYVQGNKGSDGFGGAAIDFPIRHGDTLTLRGAWKTAAGKLLIETGIDVTDKHHSIVVIGRRLIYPPKSYMRTIIKDVLYQDSGWTLGPFGYDRMLELGQKLADQYGEKLVGYSRTMGGAQGKSFTPETTNPQ